MIRRPPNSTIMSTLLPYTTLFRLVRVDRVLRVRLDAQQRNVGVVLDSAQQRQQLTDVVRALWHRSRGPFAVHADPGPPRRPGIALACPVCRDDVLRVGGREEFWHVKSSEGRRVGKECVSQGRSRWSPYP